MFNFGTYFAIIWYSEHVYLLQKFEYTSKLISSKAESILIYRILDNNNVNVNPLIKIIQSLTL